MLAGLAAWQTAKLGLLRGWFGGFRLTVATRCTNEGEIWRGVLANGVSRSTVHAKFHTNDADDVGLQNCKLYEI